MFKYSIRSKLTRKYYERRIKRFLDFIEFEIGNDIEQRCNKFAEKGKNDISWTLNKVMVFLQFQKERSRRKEITAATLGNFVKAIKLFCEMSDIPVPWKKITRGLPRIREAVNDRAPTIDEAKKLIEYPDRRIKAIIPVMASSGIRIGAWDYLKWKHVTPINDNNGQY
jgi:D-mannonate dehydratase